MKQSRRPITTCCCHHVELIVLNTRDARQVRVECHDCAVHLGQHAKAKELCRRHRRQRKLQLQGG